MYNKAILVGRLTNDPELRTTGNGVSVCTFTVAVDRPYSKGEKQADFITCVAWKERAEFVCRYFSKGKPILVEGSIQTRTYEDKHQNKRTAVEVVVDNVRFVGGKGSPDLKADEIEEIEDDGDLPF